MRNYCTVFDSAYLSRGLVLYESLKKHSSVPFRLLVLPLDEDCENQLASLLPPSLIVLGYRAFERDQRMSEIKRNRTHQEYAWTCASNVAEWLLLCPDCEMGEITYLDADLMFFSDPEQVFAEIGDRSIAAIPHRFDSPKIETNGRFNVSWVTFKGEIGKQCLSRWAAQCREWCFYRTEPGRFGDQKYLDEWPELYDSDFCEIQNIGAGLAPWNLGQYNLTAGPKVDGVPVVFYHFHEYEHGKRLTNYKIRVKDEVLIYKPYIDAYELAQKQIASVNVSA